MCTQPVLLYVYTGRAIMLGRVRMRKYLQRFPQRSEVSAACPDRLKLLTKLSRFDCYDSIVTL